MPKIEEAIEVEDAGRCLDLEELMEDLEMTDSRLQQGGTTDGCAKYDDDDDDDDDTKQQDLTPVMYVDVAHDDGDEEENDSGDDSSATDGKNRSADLDRRRRLVVLLVAFLAVIGLAVGLALFVKGINGLVSDNKTASSSSSSSLGTADETGDDTGNGDVDMSSVAIRPSDSPSPTATGPADSAAYEYTIYDQFGVDAPGEEEVYSSTTPIPAAVKTAEPTASPTSAAPVLTAQPSKRPTTDSPTAWPVLLQPTSAPFTARPSNKPTTNSPTTSPVSPSPTDAPVKAEPSNKPTLSPAVTVLPGATNTEVDEEQATIDIPAPSPIETSFRMHITTQDFTTNFLDNRSTFGRTVFSATFGLYRNVINRAAADAAKDAATNEGTVSLRPQTLKAGYGWDGCMPDVGNGCPPETVVVARFTGLATLEASVRQDDVEVLIDEVFAGVFSDASVLANWISSANEEGVMVTSVVVYVGDDEIGSYPVATISNNMGEEGIEGDGESTVAMPQEDADDNTYESGDIQSISDTNEMPVICEMEPIHVHIVAALGASFLDYNLRQILVDSTHPYLDGILRNNMGDAFWGLSLRIPQNRQLSNHLRARPRSRRRNLSHITGEDYDVQFLTKATVVGDETVCDEIRDIIFSALSGDELNNWLEKVNAFGLPVASAQVGFV